MPTPTERRRHRQGALLVDVHATCTTAPDADYTVDVYYDATGGGAGELVESLTIEAGETFGFRSLDGQEMKPFASEVWLVLPDDPRPEGLVVVVGFDRPTR